MIVNQSIRYRNAIVVDEEFLRKLDQRMMDIGSGFIDDLATASGITRNKLDELQQNCNKESDYTKRSLGNNALRCTVVRYSVEMNNGIQAQDLSIEDLIAMLKFQSIGPINITASIGHYEISRATVSLKNGNFSSAKITIYAEMMKLSHYKDSLINLLNLNGPRFRVIYHPFMASITPFFLPTLFQISISGILRHYGHQKIAGSIIPYALGIPFAFLFIYLQKRAYAAVDFRFGDYKARESLRIFVWALITIMVIPYAMGWYFAVYPPKP